MNFREALKEFNCEQLWYDFIHELHMPISNDFKSRESRQGWALICANGLLDYLSIMKHYYERLLDSYLQDCEFSINRLGIQAELAQELLEERRKLPKLTKTIGGNEKRVDIENREEGLKSISRLETTMELCKESEGRISRRNRTGIALTILSKSLDDAEKLIEKRIVGICESYDLPNVYELGQQQGPDYFHKKGQPYYSGPQNPPQRPTVSPLIPGHVEDPATEKCWCAWCEQIIPKPRKANGDLSRCEDNAHLCKDGEMRMLTTAIKMGNDTREHSNDMWYCPKCGYLLVNPGIGIEFIVCPKCGFEPHPEVKKDGRKTANIRQPFHMDKERDMTKP